MDNYIVILIGAGRAFSKLIAIPDRNSLKCQNSFNDLKGSPHKLLCH